MAEHRTQHWLRRGAALSKLRKAELCAMYRALGGLGGKYPPEKWRKDEVVTSIVEMEWSRLPEDAKLPDPPRMTPPCDTCGGGQNAEAHRYGGDHHYRNTFDADAAWVPESEKEAIRIEGLGHRGQTRENGDGRPGDDQSGGPAGGHRAVPAARRDGAGEGALARSELDAVPRDELG